MQESIPTSAMAQRPGPSWVGWAMAPAFIGLAAWLGTRGPGVDVPVARGASFDRAVLAARPLRVALADPAVATVEGVTQRCGACHEKDVPAPLPRPASPHAVALRHGMNDWCFNCHDVMDRERLALQDTTTVAYAEVPVLCAQCHGTTYRDWQKGTHGKSMGSWDQKGAGQKRLLCTECHDPHGPAYGKIAPLPGPGTLRMGGPSEEHGPMVEPSPLTHWRQKDAHNGEPR